MKNILASLFSKKISDTNVSINNDLDKSQEKLENDGFKVKRTQNMVHNEVAQSLTAVKGNVILTATRFIRGGKNLSITLKHHDHATTLPLFSYNLDEAIAIANNINY